MKSFIFLSIAMIVITSCNSKPKLDNSPPNTEMITQSMLEQQNCWNNGDIECFMQYYWESDSLQFLTKRGMSKGWNRVLENYKKSYNTPEKMGVLTFDIIEHVPLSITHVITLGKWEVVQSNDTLSGAFTLLWEKKQEGWKIVLDHTS